ncbi:MAG: hypothetical protein CMO81_11315 [Waddliaceae bacterium]|nr:hypothetical protein [Waddliaceae bacterium]
MTIIFYPSTEENVPAYGAPGPQDVQHSEVDQTASELASKTLGGLSVTSNKAGSQAINNLMNQLRLTSSKWDTVLSKYSKQGLASVESDDPNDINDDVDVGGPDKGGNDGLTPTFFIDMTEAAIAGEYDHFVGRHEEVRQVLRSLVGGFHQRHALLLGPSGRGKRSILKRLAYEMTKRSLPDNINKKHLIAFDIDDLFSKRDWLQSFKDALDILAEKKDECICVIPQLDKINDKYREGSIAIEYLETKMKEGLQVVATADAYNPRYAKFFDEGTGVSRIEVKEAGQDTVLLLVQKAYLNRDEELGVIIKDNAVETAVALAAKHIKKERLPATKLFDYACTYLELAIAEARLRGCDGPCPEGPGGVPKPVVTTRIVQEVYCAETNTPLSEVLEVGLAVNLPLKDPLSLEDRLNNRVFGQGLAIHSVSQAILRYVAGLKSPDSPVGTYLFLGPTGVGKTELSKSLADEVYGGKDKIIRIDMSEYQQKHEVSRLIGAPPGYIGYDEGGQLTEAIKNNPKSVVLLDEIEKAHPNVWKIFLQVFDEGRLTDGQGNTVDCRQVLFIMTSNLLSLEIAQMLSRDMTQAEILDEIEPYLIRHLSPEFYNRIDKTIPFNMITEEVFRQVIPFKLEGLKKEILKLKNIELDWGEDIYNYLVEHGYDQALGLRPLARVLERDLKDALTDGILRNEFGSGDKVQLFVLDGEVCAQRIDS